jgi:hypothetical protein
MIIMIEDHRVRNAGPGGGRLRIMTTLREGITWIGDRLPGVVITHRRDMMTVITGQLTVEAIIMTGSLGALASAIRNIWMSPG